MTARRWAILGVALPVLGLSSFGLYRTMAVVPPPRPVAVDEERSAGKDASTPAQAPSDGEENDHAYSFRIPSGEPAALSCEAARAIIGQARAGLAYEPDPVSAHAIASGTADWLDPHGLWSAAPDAPIEAALEQQGAALVRTLEVSRDDDCAPAREVGAHLVTWIAELRKRFDDARTAATLAPDAASAADDSLFESAASSRPAKELAALLGKRVGAFERALGGAADPYAKAARARFFPELDAPAWGRAVLAAAVRSYVQIVDPHGAWAPFDEESSVYEIDLESRPPDRLWDRATRTALGLRLDGQPVLPLQPNDVLLSIAGLPTAGLPLEQIEQLSFAASESASSVPAVVLRTGEVHLRTLSIALADDPSPTPSSGQAYLPVDRVPYAAGDALVVRIQDVRDDLGEELARALEEERQSDTRPIVGMVLDLRGNGGGSTEGAIAALGMFLPGANLFPMKRRDGTIETDRAPEPPAKDRWAGPVATLVDGETASAAEMIAGALSAYRRGASVGTPTYGKGCAQEYVDDEAHAGVLRLTTLLYALPDGAAVQRVGLSPTVLLPLSSSVASDGAGGSATIEREATLPHAPPTWRGPDVREGSSVALSEAAASWPAHGGSVGPCKDGDVCRALRALGNGVSKRISSSSSKPAH
jgi:carboxyl-terminal processing protease